MGSDFIKVALVRIMMPRIRKDIESNELVRSVEKIGAQI